MSRQLVNRPAPTLTLADHLKELKNRFFLIIATLLVSSSLVYVYRDAIIPIVLDPYKKAFGEEQLMYLNPAGGFNFIFFISIYAGLAVTIPILIQQLYLFVRPILPVAKRQVTGRLLLASSALLVAGVLFGYFIAIPGALGFLKDFATDYVSASLTADSYIHFLMSYTIGLGLLFQFPLLLILIDFIKPLTPTQLLKSERWVIIFCMVAAAIITPTPDPINMLIVAVPLIAMYQIGVVFVLLKILHTRKKTRKKLAIQAKKLTKVQPRPATVSVPPTATVAALKEAAIQPQQVRRVPAQSPVKTIDGFKRSTTIRPTLASSRSQTALSHQPRTSHDIQRMGARSTSMPRSNAR